MEVEAVAGVRAQRAFIPGAKLYEDTYASLVFDEISETFVRGWMLTADPKLFRRKEKWTCLTKLKDTSPMEVGCINALSPKSALGTRRIVLGSPLGRKALL